MTAVTAKPGTDPVAAAERRANHSTEVVADRPGGVRDCAGETDHSQSDGEAGPGVVQHYLMDETLPHG